MFITHVSFTLFSRILDPLITKTSSKKVILNTSFGFFSFADVCAVTMATSININRPLRLDNAIHWINHQLIAWFVLLTFTD